MTKSSLALVVACGDSTATSGGDQTTTGSTETGAYVDQVPCDPPSCSVDAACCRPNTAGATFADMDCSSSARYPMRWVCDSGDCVNLGCDPEAVVPKRSS